MPNGLLLRKPQILSLEREYADNLISFLISLQFLKVVVTDETRQTLDALKSLVKADNAKKAEELVSHPFLHFLICFRIKQL